MESRNLRDGGAPDFNSTDWLNHTVSSAYERVIHKGQSALAEGEQYVQEHKLLAVGVTGAIAVAAALAFRGRVAPSAEEISAVAQKFLPDASKVFKPDLVDFDTVKVQQLTEDASSSD